MWCGSACSCRACGADYRTDDERLAPQYTATAATIILGKKACFLISSTRGVMHPGQNAQTFRLDARMHFGSWYDLGCDLPCADACNVVRVVRESELRALAPAEDDCHVDVHALDECAPVAHRSCPQSCLAELRPVHVPSQGSARGLVATRALQSTATPNTRSLAYPGIPRAPSGGGTGYPRVRNHSPFRSFKTNTWLVGL